MAGYQTQSVANVFLNQFIDDKRIPCLSFISCLATPFGQVNANIGNILAVTATNSVNYVGLQPTVYTNPILRPYRYILPTPVNAPATNGFFASVTIPTAAGDTAVIMDDGSLLTGTNWELWSDNSWHNISTAWGGYDASMAILPEMQCGVTFVFFFSFCQRKKKIEIEIF